MENNNLESFLKELNKFFDDDTLKSLSKELRYSISSMTSPDKFNNGHKLFEGIKKDYLDKVHELLNEKFEDKLKHLEQFK